MSEGVPKTEKKYPVEPEDVETEKEIVEAIQKLTPTSLKLKAFAINHNLLKLKELEKIEQDEITQKDLEGAKAFQPSITSINEIINATRPPKEDELKNLEQYFTPEELAKKDELLAQIKPIPDYWLTAMRNHPVLSRKKKEAIKENDAAALKHLIKIEYKISEDPQHPLNYSLHFTFTPNEYFENEVLSVNLHIKEPRECTKIEGTEIKWKEGKNLTRKTVQKKQRNKKTGQTRTVTKEEDCDSFFNLFKDCEQCDHEHEHDDEEEDHAHDQIFDHTEWAYSIFEELLPYNLEYFLGVRKEFGEEDDEDDFEDEGDDDDEDDDDDAGAKKKGKAKPAAGKASKPAGGEDAKKECKQQ